MSKNPTRAIQTAKLTSLLEIVTKSNPFYRKKLRGARLPADLDRLSELPLTVKQELVDDQLARPPFGTNLTFALDRYTRLHHTSGTSGAPLRWLDTPESWAWWLENWEEIYRAAGVGIGDRVFVAFSFGPFIGFWTAFEAAHRLGAMSIPGGGLTSIQRLRMIEATGATVLVCTPTYALRLAGVAQESEIDLGATRIHTTIHAGEPGASLPSVRLQIESSWGARVVDHVGATELGAWGYSCGHADHVHVIEPEFIPEVVDSGGNVAPDDGGVAEGELVLTNLGRTGSPLIRYRTGDLVRLASDPCPCGRDTRYLIGGVLGRADDMIVVRGVNVFPSAIENIVRHFDDIVEFEVEAATGASMIELRIRIEAPEVDGVAVAGALADRLHEHINLRPQVVVVPAGSLPRYDLKAQRFRIVRDEAG